MKPLNTLNEAHKYLLYIADALANVSSGYKIDKQDRIILEKYANDLAEYAKGIEQVKNNIVMKEEVRKKEMEGEEDK